MKKLLAIVLALAMVLSVSIAVSAADFSNQWGDESGSSSEPEKPEAFFEVSLIESDYEYVRGEDITFVVSVKDINLPGKTDIGGTLISPINDGIGLLAFNVLYDPEFLTPKFAAAEDGDGDKGDLSAVVTKMPSGWECLGKINAEEGIVDIAVADGNDIKSLVPARTDGSIAFAFTFTVADDCEEDKLSITCDCPFATNADGKKECYSTSRGIDITKATPAIQPEELEALPASAISLDYAGYKHVNGVSFIYHTDAATTVGAITEKFVGSVKDANAFGIIMFGDDGIVNYVNLKLGRKTAGSTEIVGEKDAVPVPANTFVIGVNAYGADGSGTNPEFTPFNEKVKLGSIIKVYNINNEGFPYLTEAVALKQAGFTITNLEDVPSDADVIKTAGFIFEADQTVIMATDKETTLAELAGRGGDYNEEETDLNYWGVIIFNKDDGAITYQNKTLGRPSGIKSDVVVPENSYVIAVHGSNATINNAKVGDIVTLYNADFDTLAALKGNVPANKMGYKVAEPAPEVFEFVLGAPIDYDEVKGIIRVFADDTFTEAEFAKLIINKEKLVFADKDGKAIGKYVGTGATVKIDGTDVSATIIIMGDVDCNGEVNAKDYGLMKRHCLNTYKITGIAEEAGKLLGGSTIAAKDYGYCKRVCLKTAKMVDLNK